MQTVEVTARLDAPRSAVEDALSPRAIVEYEGTYEVTTVEERDDGCLVVGEAEELEISLLFTGRADGYTYEQADRGPFEELETTVTVTDGDEGTDGGDAADPGTAGDDGTARVRMRSEFTFGGWFAPLFDRLAKRSRRDELEQAVANLAGEVREPEPNAAD